LRVPRLVILGLVLLLCGCATIRHAPPPGLKPAHEITVFTDGFHSGLILDRSALPASFDPRDGDEISRYPEISLHFGEEKWTAGEDNSWLHALSLVIIPGAGVVQSDHTRSGLIDIPGLHLERLRRWTFPVNQAGLDHLRLTLRRDWMTGIVLPRAEGEASNLYRSPKSWSVFHNCHDFTLDLLASAGLDLHRRWLYLAGGLATDLDDASAELEAAGIRVIGIAP
jgi:hypothetical protein